MISDFAKEKVLWTDKMNLKLVKFIQSRPVIWNRKHPKYTSVAYKDKTYAEFAAKYGNVFTGHAVKDRWKNIRSTFASYLRKLSTSRVKAAKGDGEEYKVHWHLWDACQFLRKENQCSNKSSTITSGDNNANEMDDSNTEKPDDTSDKELSGDNIDECNIISCDNIVDNLLIAFRGVQNNAFGLENQRHDEIGRLVTMKLSQLTSLEASRVSIKIIEILHLYNQSNPMNPNNTTTFF